MTTTTEHDEGHSGNHKHHAHHHHHKNPHNDHSQHHHHHHSHNKDAHHSHDDHHHHHHHHEHDGHEHHHHHHDHSHNGHSHSHSHDHGGHGHTHEKMDNPGSYVSREKPLQRDYVERAYTIGIGGPVGSGKTALMYALCRAFRNDYSVVAVTNDIFTQEDGEFLVKHSALSPDRIRPIETGGCPHAAIREDISANLQACEELTAMHNADLVLVESGGDNLAANFSRELADYIIYVIDVAGGDKVPRKGGPGITQSDLLVINKTDLAQAVGADLDLMKQEANVIRGGGPVVMAQVKFELGVGEIKRLILEAFKEATGMVRPSHKHKEGQEDEDQAAHKKHKVDQPQAQAQPTA